MKEVLKDKKFSYKSRIIEFLDEQKVSVDIEKIRKSCGIGNWNTALKHCLELFIDGKISGQKSSKSWIFWSNKKVVSFE